MSSGRELDPDGLPKRVILSPEMKKETLIIIIRYCNFNSLVWSRSVSVAKCNSESV